MSEKIGYDIRSILNEMQQEYWQGLSEKIEVQEDLLECVTFILGGEIYAFETVSASEVIRVPKLIRVPGVKGLITGIFNLRGEIIAAMDIRPLLGLPAGPLDSAARIIVIKGESFNTGIIVESVQGVHPLPLDQFEAVVKSVDPAAREFLRGQISLEGEMTILLDLKRLLASQTLIIDN
jgi:purine-binding chemotaxis protein CheW